VGHFYPNLLICLGPDFPCVGHPVVDLIDFFGKVVGDLGIEPSVRLREGVTVPCHTLRPVAHFHRALRCVRVITCVKKHRQQENPLK